MTTREAGDRAVRVVIAGGGTGGHLYPGIAIAREILARDEMAVVTFAGTARGIEMRLVPQEGFELDVIRSAGLQGKSMTVRLRGLMLVPFSLLDAWRLLSKRRPDVVIGVGGYSSGPIVLTAALRRIPTIVLEQNAVPGLTNRWLSRVVRAAAVTYAETLVHFRGRGFVAGNPVRAEFFMASNRDAKRTDFVEGRAPSRRVLIVGGSQGAHAINVAMVEAAVELVRRHPGLEIVHQTGQADVADVRAGYERAGIAARAQPFLDGMVGEMTAADLVICRAGSTTLAELAAIGRAAVLVPLPSVDEHQMKNARVLANAGAAIAIEQRQLSGERLLADVDGILGDDVRRASMAAAMRTLAKPDAAKCIVDRIAELVGASGNFGGLAARASR